jgi:hypothetical protein
VLGRALSHPTLPGSMKYEQDRGTATLRPQSSYVTVSTQMSNNSSEASSGLFPKHFSALCTWHFSGLDASAHAQHGAWMIEYGFKAMTPPE